MPDRGVQPTVIRATPRTVFARRMKRLLGMSISEIAGRSRQLSSKVLDRFAPARIPLHEPTQGGPGRQTGRAPVPGLAAPQRVATFLRERHPEEGEHLRKTAHDIMCGRLEVLGHGILELGSVPRWDYEAVTGKASPRAHWSRIPYLDSRVVGDSKVVWEINRHQFLVTLGQAYQLTADARHAERIWRLVDSWISSNRPGYGINWTSSLELAFRSISWCWAWHLGAGASCLTRSQLHRFVRTLDLHGRHIEKYLSYYFAPNTHLTGEALGLCYLATSWPDLDRAEHWWRLGTRILAQEAGSQINRDGTYFERSACYQLYTLDFFLHYLLLCETRGVSAPEAVVVAASRLARSVAVLRRPDAQLPNFGDDDGGRLLFLGRAPPLDPRGTLTIAGSLLGASHWLSGEHPAADAVWVLGVERYNDVCKMKEHDANTINMHERQLHAFSSAGILVSRGNAGDYLLASAGTQTPQPRCLGHVHDDALSFELWCRHEPVFVDAGTYTFTGDLSRRRWFRSAAAHNSARVDGVPDLPSGEPFHWSSLDGGQLVRYGEGPLHHLIELARKIRIPTGIAWHRRRIIAFHGIGWVIWDRFHGAGHHDVRLRFQLPSGIPDLGFTRGFAKLPSSYVAILPPNAADWNCRLVDSSVSQRYGQLGRAPAWEVTARTALPTDVLTMVLHQPQDGYTPQLVESPRTKSHVPGQYRDLEVDVGEAHPDRIILQDQPNRTITLGDTAEQLTTTWISDRADALLLDPGGAVEQRAVCADEWSSVAVSASPLANETHEPER